MSFARGMYARRYHRIALLEQDVEKSVAGYSIFILSSDSHLAGRDNLQRAEGGLEVGSVALKVIKSLSNGLLELRGVLPRGAVGGDLVQGLGAHLD